jgi:hypothetical protein
VKILEIVGQSERPLSAREIEDRFVRNKIKTVDNKKKLTNPYVYILIKDLVGRKKDYGELVLTWKELEDIEKKEKENATNNNSVLINEKVEKEKKEAVNSKLKLYNRINNIYNLDWEVGKKGDSHDYIRLERLNTGKKNKEEEHTDQLEIFVMFAMSPEKEDIMSSLSSYDIFSNSVGFIRNKQSENISLIVTRNGKIDNKTYGLRTLSLSLYGPPDPNQIPIIFLETTLKDEAHKRIAELQKRRKIIPDIKEVTYQGQDRITVEDVVEEEEKAIEEIIEIYNNRKNIRYALPIRGLLLYLLKTSDNRSIRKTIKNLSLDLERFPFLLHYMDFEKLFGSSFLIRLLKDIAIELQNQLDTHNLDFLEYWVTNRYFCELNSRVLFKEKMSQPFYIALSKGKYRKYIINSETHKKIKHYRLMMLHNLKEYEEKLVADRIHSIKEVEQKDIWSPSFIH